MVEQFTAFICAGIFPSIENTIRNVARAENEWLEQEGVKKYLDHMKKLSLPTNTTEKLHEYHREGVNLALKYFTEGVVFDMDNKYNTKMSVRKQSTSSR